MEEAASPSSRIMVLGKDGQAMRVIGEFASRNGYEVVEARDVPDAARIMGSAEGPRIAVIDSSALGGSPASAAPAFAAKGDFSPYLILMAAEGEREKAAGLSVPGTKDLLLKPFQPRELHDRLEVGRRLDELERKLRKARAEAADLTLVDILTRVPNRKAILDRLKAEMTRVSRGDSELYVGAMDIDRFASINDSYGEAVGDCVLIECVSRAVSVLRPYDAIGRLEGGEFLLVLPLKEAADPFPVFERVRRAIGRQSVQEGELSIPATVSIGVARCEQWNGAEELVARAEGALSRAKEGGRDRVMLAD